MVVLLSNSFATLQAKIMDRHITSGFENPPGSCGVLSVATITFWVAFNATVVVPLLAKNCGMPNGLDPKFCMALGLLLSCISMIIAGVVESIRQKMAIDHGMEGQPDTVVDMSAMWLAPQLILIGFAEALNLVGRIEFYYKHLSKNMSSVAMGILTLVLGAANLVGSLVVLVDKFSSRGGKQSWLSDNLNKGHVDYYYYLLAFLGFANFRCCLLCYCKVHGSSQDSVRRRQNETGKEDSDYTALALLLDS